MTDSVVLHCAKLQESCVFSAREDPVEGHAGVHLIQVIEFGFCFSLNFH